MNAKRPAEARREESPGGLPERSEELGLRFEIRGRLHAVLQELEPPTVEWDVVQTILEGAVEAIQAQS